MRKRMPQITIFGIGPLLAIVGASSFVVIVALQKMLRFEISIPLPWEGIIQIIGIVFCIIGLIFWLSSAVLVKKAFGSRKLATSGVFRFSRNPMYAAFIVFIVPGLSFILNDLVLLIPSLTMYVAFKLRVEREEDYLSNEFGEQYKRYCNSVPQLIPFIKV